MQLSIIIPTYNGKHLLNKNLPSIIAATQNISCEVIIVDNGSIDDTNELVTKYTNIHWVMLPKNTGFTGGCNRAAEKAKGKYICFINNDCVVEHTTFEKLLTYITENNIIATQPIIKNNKGTIEHIGFWIDTKIGKAHIISSKTEYEKVLEENKLYGLSGTCLMIQRNIFCSIGMFDESFHSYLEDVDLAITLFEKRLLISPCFSTEVIHDHMSTSKKMGSYKQKRDMINWIKIIKKHPKIFPLSPKLLVERLRNISGYLKTYL